MAARPVWSGVISFGLLNIPVSLYSGERRVDLHFRMLDSRDNSPIRYERVNAETGEEVPWKEIVKGFEYAKNNYIIMDEKELKAAAPKGGEAVEIEGFVRREEISPIYFEKPYYLVPGKKAEKGYVLLREILRRTDRVGLGRVVIRTREYLGIVMTIDNALVLNLLRYPQEVVDVDEFRLPDKELSEYRISDKEIEMAQTLLESMTMAWQPENYQDTYRERLQAIVERRLAEQGGAAVVEEPEEVPTNAATNVVDFRKILQESLRKKGLAGGAGAAAADEDEEEKPAPRKRSGSSKKAAEAEKNDKSEKKSTPRKSAAAKSGTTAKSASKRSAAKSTPEPKTTRRSKKTA